MSSSAPKADRQSMGRSGCECRIKKKTHFLVARGGETDSPPHPRCTHVVQHQIIQRSGDGSERRDVFGHGLFTHQALENGEQFRAFFRVNHAVFQHLGHAGIEHVEGPTGQMLGDQEVRFPFVDDPVSHQTLAMPTSSEMLRSSMRCLFCVKCSPGIASSRC